MDNANTYAAFIGDRLIANGPLEAILHPVKDRFDRDPSTLFLIFEEETGWPVDFDLRGSLDQVIARATPPKPRTGPGRPRLGVASREVSLLPRHWEWLEQQPNGASAALRRLVDQARLQEPDRQRSRRAREAVGRFLSAMAGNRPGYEEACRALYTVDRARFEKLIRKWPKDIKKYLQGRAGEAFWTGA